MNLNINLNHVLFLDIETVPKFEDWEELSEKEKHLFEIKTAYQRKEELSAKEFYNHAGIWAEFGKIICISVGFFHFSGTERQFRVRSFFGDDESKILRDFKSLLDTHFSRPEHLLCAHNGKEFDFPFIARRMLVLGIDLPKKLNLFGKKPWEVPHLDTLELWKFGDYKNYISLDLLTTTLNIPTPKDDIDGSKVAQVYYKEKDVSRIVNYCEKDTIAVAQILLRMNNEPILTENQLVKV